MKNNVIYNVQRFDLSSFNLIKMCSKTPNSSQSINLPEQPT